MNTLFASKKIVILIIVLAIIFFILLVVALFLTPSNKSQPNPTTTALIPGINPYKPGAASKDFERLNNPQPLSEPDAQIKQKFLNTLGNKSGQVHQTDKYDIQYVKAADQFMIEIFQGDPEIAKKETVDWLKSQGLSQAGVCNLPVMFFLSQDASTYLKTNNKQFDPTPPGC